SRISSSVEYHPDTSSCPCAPSTPRNAWASRGNLFPNSIPENPASRASARHTSNGVSPPISIMSSLDHPIGFAPIRIICLPLSSWFPDAVFPTATSPSVSPQARPGARYARRPRLSLHFHPHRRPFTSASHRAPAVRSNTTPTPTHTHAPQASPQRLSFARKLVPQFHPRKPGLPRLGQTHLQRRLPANLPNVIPVKGRDASDLMEALAFTTSPRVSPRARPGARYARRPRLSLATPRSPPPLHLRLILSPLPPHRVPLAHLG